MPNNSMDVRAKQRLSYQRFLVNSNGLVGGFAPRQRRRWLSFSGLEINFLCALFLNKQSHKIDLIF